MIKIEQCCLFCFVYFSLLSVKMFSTMNSLKIDNLLYIFDITVKN